MNCIDVRLREACGVVTTPLARWANFSVESDSAKASAAGRDHGLARHRSTEHHGVEL